MSSIVYIVEIQFFRISHLFNRLPLVCISDGNKRILINYIRIINDFKLNS